jgi:hypothetical protein
MAGATWSRSAASPRCCATDRARARARRGGSSSRRPTRRRGATPPRGRARTYRGRSLATRPRRRGRRGARRRAARRDDESRPEQRVHELGVPSPVRLLFQRLRRVHSGPERLSTTENAGTMQRRARAARRGAPRRALPGRPRPGRAEPRTSSAASPRRRTCPGRWRDACRPGRSPP